MKRSSSALGLVFLLISTCGAACGGRESPTPGTTHDAGTGGHAGGGSDGGPLADAGGKQGTGSAFGVFAAFAGEFGDFQKAMGQDLAAYQAFAGARLGELGARWSRSNMQLVWDLVEPAVGGPRDYSASLGGEAVFAAAAKHDVRYLAVFHTGGSNLRNPLDQLDAWKSFVRATVERYDGDGVDDAPGGVVIHDFQVGNEIPMWTDNGRTADDYVTWFAATAEAAREADPNVRLVVIASLSGVTIDPFHEKVIAGLSSKGVRYDAIDIHHWGRADLTSSRMSAVPDYQAALTKAGAPEVEIWSTEHGTYIGRPVGPTAQCPTPCTSGKVCTVVGCMPACTSDATCPPAMPSCDLATGICGNPEQTQADQARAVVYRYVVNRALGVRLIDWENLVGWHCFKGACGGLFDLMGLVSDGFGPSETAADAGKARLSFHTYRMLAARTDDLIAEQQGEVATGDAKVHVYGYRHRTSGAAGVVAWADDARTATLAWAASTAKLTGLVTDASGTPLRSEAPAVAGGQISVALDPSPVWIAPDATW